MAATVMAVILLSQSCSIFRRDCSLQDVVCVGLVPGYGGIEGGIEQQVWLALQDAHAAGAADRIENIETIDTRDRQANIAYFASAGYDIIVTTGGGIADETIAAAQRHPNALFIIVQPGHEPLEAPQNLVKLEFREEQGGFLAGATAATITRTHRVAAVCEARFIDYIERYCEGFAAGAKFVDGHVQTSISYRTGVEELLFQDIEWGTAAAAQAVEDGADVVFAVGESTGRAALVEAAGRGALVIGAQEDLFEEEPEIREQLVTSAVPGVRSALLSVIIRHLNEHLAPGAYWGEMGLAPFHDYENRLPPGAADRLAGIQVDLASGKLDTNLPVQGP